MKNVDHYATLAGLFRYPSKGLKKAVVSSQEILLRYDPGLITVMKPFFDHVTTQPLAVQQEYYTGTFDVQPVSTLDIGYVLFGDDYRRGVFLVNMKAEQAKAGNDCGSELPDHLPNILTLLPLMSDRDLAEELVCSLLIPALTEMIRRFRKTENHYRALLEILLAVMEKDFPSTAYERFHFSIKTTVK